MCKEKFNLTEEQLIAIEKCYENEDSNELNRICTELKIKLGEIKTFDTMSYKLLEYIESNDELVEKLRELSKERKALQKLFPYYQKKENMRFFVDNKDEYGLTNIDLKKMEKFYIGGLNNNNYKIYKERDKFWKKHGFKITIIFELVIIIFTYNCFIRQYFITSVIKKANITNAVVLEDNRHRYTGDYLTVNWKVKYEYNVDGVKYEKNQNATIIGYDIFANLDDSNVVKVYYEKNNPSKVKIYQYGLIWDFCMICSLVLILALFIRLVMWRKD